MNGGSGSRRKLVSNLVARFYLCERSWYETSWYSLSDVTDEILTKLRETYFLGHFLGSR